MTALTTRMSAALLLASALALPAAAQEADGSGFMASPDEPIEVVSDTAEWRRGEQIAIFKGRVDALQGTMRLRADTVYVHYKPKDTGSEGDEAPEPEEAAPADTAPGGGQSITKIEARDHVIITDDKEGQTAEGDWADYVISERKIYMGDTVVLTQGDNVIRGQKLVFNLETGESVVEAGEPGASGTQGGRVRSFFAPENAPEEPKDETGGEAAPAPTETAEPPANSAP